MENIEYEEEEQIYSESHRQQKEVKNFKEYLVNSGTIHHFVKCIHWMIKFCLDCGRSKSTMKACPILMLFRCLESILEPWIQIQRSRMLWKNRLRLPRLKKNS